MEFLPLLEQERYRSIFRTIISNKTPTAELLNKELRKKSWREKRERQSKSWRKSGDNWFESKRSIGD